MPETTDINLAKMVRVAGEAELMFTAAVEAGASPATASAAALGPVSSAFDLSGSMPPAELRFARCRRAVSVANVLVNAA